MGINNHALNKLNARNVSNLIVELWILNYSC